MDIFNMLQNAIIIDTETDNIAGQTIGFEIVNGRMTLKAVLFDSISDPDDGEKEPAPEEEPVLFMEKLKEVKVSNG